MAVDPKTGKELLSESDYQWAARELGVEVEVIKAVAKVESAGHGFQRQTDGHVAPLILFEAHIFGRLTAHRFEKTHPNLSSRTWNRSLYGPSLRQHQRLAMAGTLNRDAALMSCSWGKLQLMGVEWRENGYPSLQAFINAMYRSERDHLEGFVSFCKRKRGLLPAMRVANFQRIAYLYNGPGYAKNAYDVKMRAAYNRFKQGAK